MSKLYLTLDDGPSTKFKAFVDFLYERNIPAIFFNRGDAMEERPEAVIYGIKKGYVMANHAYSHQKFSNLSLGECYHEISRTEVLLDELYKQADAPRETKYFRFPYMDRGMGPSLIETNNFSDMCLCGHEHLITTGLGHELAYPDDKLIQKKKALQKHLSEQGFTNIPAENVTIPWYVEAGFEQGIDSLCTFSTSDWVLTERNMGRYGLNNLKDLTDLIDNDEGLKRKGSNHIILAHDQEETHDTTITLIDHFLKKGFGFL